jgi:large subunit ribosomal protein L21
MCPPEGRLVRRPSIYAVVRSGGKQYKVEPDQLLDVELLPADVGAVVELADVLLVADGDDVTVGQPLVAGARVVAEVVEHGRGPKIIVFKYKNKTRYRRRTGHRQAFTRLAIRQILMGGEPAAAAAPAKARRRRAPAKPAAKPKAAPPEAEEAAAAAEQPEAAPVSEAPVAEEAPAAAEPASMEAAPPAEAPKTRRRKPAAPKATEEAPPKPTRSRPARRAKRGE